MAHFYRDQLIANLTINEEIITELNTAFVNRMTELSLNIQPNDPDKSVIISYIIRFDNKGYRVFSLNELLQYYNQAKYVERIIIMIETLECIRTSRHIGSFMELKLDEKAPNGCSMVVSSDDGNWTDTSFCAVKEILDKSKNINSYFRNSWSVLLIQILGLVLGFGFSLWAASYISPKLNIENAFVISFIFVLLVFSNIWSYLNQILIMGLNKLFPNLKFYRPSKERFHWFMQAIVGGIAVAVTLYFLGNMFSYIGEILGAFINKNA
ncbi:MAG: hypothetical protein WC762_05980 [Methylobacter sp.]|jgi:hypothetical protein